MIRALIFDLDDTLYRETDFVASGFRAAARLIAMRCGREPHPIVDFMLAKCMAEGRREVFPAVLERFPESGLKLADLVAEYRSHQPDIALSAETAAVLAHLATRYRLGLITDGNPEVQRAKCRAL